ncbi:MAG TPA: M23 family metallopeptidase [Sandaracinaceae bacterium LLY-WYZ-13_1]|nr:M23 family metallopeptidase [Sandaracinaceae bacterium LLY-WYZ-13_1]
MRWLLALAPVAAALVATSARAQPEAVSPIRPDPMRPRAWLPSEGDECYARERGRDGVIAQDRICDGPRRVPESTGAAAERAERLGLGTRPAADRLRIGRPPEEWLAAIPSAPRDDLLWPVARGLFSRGFGRVRREEIHHRPHNGVDIVGALGAHVRAANDGLVVYADNGVRGYGNFLVLLHADGTATFYGHCRAIYVAPGQLVARGQVVAEVGNTGRPHVPHLHFEWRRDGHPMDPIRHFAERPDASAIRPDEQTDFAPPPPNVRPEARGPERPRGACATPCYAPRRGPPQEEEEA